jgi:hypothetical protein
LQTKSSFAEILLWGSQSGLGFMWQYVPFFSIMRLQCWESLIGTMSVLHRVCLFTNLLSTKAFEEALVGPCSETCILRCCHMNELAMTHSSKAIWGPRVW